jgi:hypothetical protein
VPTKIQLFLWIMSHNKLAIVDNMNKRGMPKPMQCQFCNEEESINHLFFGCAVAKVNWGYAKDFLKIEIDFDYVSVASKWVCVDKFYVTNVISNVVLRGLWLIRNDCVQ